MTNAKLYKLNGQARPLVEWAEELGVSQETLRARIRKGWPLHKALSAPASNAGRPKKARPNNVRLVFRSPNPVRGETSDTVDRDTPTIPIEWIVPADAAEAVRAQLEGVRKLGTISDQPSHRFVFSVPEQDAAQMEVAIGELKKAIAVILDHRGVSTNFEQ